MDSGPAAIRLVQSEHGSEQVTRLIVQHKMPQAVLVLVGLLGLFVGVLCASLVGALREIDRLAAEHQQVLDRASMNDTWLRTHRHYDGPQAVPPEERRVEEVQP